MEKGEGEGRNSKEKKDDVYVKEGEEVAVHHRVETEEADDHNRHVRQELPSQQKVILSPKRGVGICRGCRYLGLIALHLGTQETDKEDRIGAKWWRRGNLEACFL